jgi:gas vesicle protein
MLNQNQNRGIDPLTAFAIGSAVGVTLALLLVPRRKPSLKTELQRAVKGTRKDFFKSGKRLRGRTGDLVEDGAQVLADIRKELQSFVEEARESLRDTVNDELKSLEKGLSKRRTRLLG